MRSQEHATWTVSVFLGFYKISHTAGSRSHVFVFNRILHIYPIDKTMTNFLIGLCRMISNPFYSIILT